MAPVLLKLDLHVHSIHSTHTGLVGLFLRYDSICTPRSIVKMVKRRGLSGVAVVDHNNLRGSIAIKREVESISDQILVIPGEEVSTSGGHIIALYIQEEVKPHLGVEETIEQIHELGGIAIAAHPYNPNLKHFATQNLAKVDAVEVLNASIPGPFNEKARTLANALRKPGTAGSDAHIPEHIGRAYTLVRSEEASVEAAVKAIKRGLVSVQGRELAIHEIVYRYAKKLYYNLVPIGGVGSK